jgi:hypothetical protein
MQKIETGLCLCGSFLSSNGTNMHMKIDDDDAERVMKLLLCTFERENQSSSALQPARYPKIA